MTDILELKDLQPLNQQGAPLAPVVRLSLQAGEVLFVRGDNGSGKSTLLKTILGLHKNFKGQYKLNIPESSIQYLPQLGNLTFHLPFCLKDMLPSLTSESPLLKGLDLNKKWNTASGGERQKVLLAEILAQKPKLLVLDEPFNHVDAQATSDLEEALGFYLNENPDSSLIIVSHRALVQSWSRVRFLELK